MNQNTNQAAVTKPSVSVLMAVYNTAPYLRQALESISKQTFADLELVVVDDGSTDGSSELLKDYARVEPRMRLICRPNKGLIATRNELLQLAQADLIAWMDSDDVSMPDRLALQVRAFDENPGLVCLGGFAQCIDPDGEMLNLERYPLNHADILQAQGKGGAMRFPTTMVRKAAALGVGGFREPFKMGEDFDFLLRLSEIGQMANIADIVYLYRQHTTSVCAMLGQNWLTYRDAILKLSEERKETGKDRLQRGENLNLTLLNKKPENHLIANTYLHWADYAAANNNRPQAWRYLGRALKANPTNIKCWKSIAKLILK